MSTTWPAQIAPNEPVSGDPHEFLAVEQRFGRIENSMRDLDQSFDSIRNGTSDDFRGAAADAFRGKLNAIATAVGEVPMIAGQLEITFRNHRRELERLQREANQAVARAQANWNEKRAADSDHHDAASRLSFVDRQIDWLESKGDLVDDSDRAYWTSERIEVQSWVSTSAGRQRRAADAVDGSQRDWKRLDDEEYDLDSRTKAALGGTVLWSLADPSFLEQLADSFDALLDAFAELGAYVFSMDLVEDLYKIVDALLTVVSFVAMVLTLLTAVIPVLAPLTAAVGTIAMGLAIAKIGLGLALVCGGRMDLTIFAIEATLAVVAIFAGAVAKNGTGFLGRSARVGTHQFTYKAAAVTKKAFEVAEGVEFLVDVARDPLGVVTLEPLDLRGDDAVQRAGGHVSRGVSHFDFDPPPKLGPLRMQPISVFPVRLAPTGW